MTPLARKGIHTRVRNMKRGQNMEVPLHERGEGGSEDGRLSHSEISSTVLTAGRGGKGKDKEKIPRPEQTFLLYLQVTEMRYSYKKAE